MLIPPVSSSSESYVALYGSSTPKRMELWQDSSLLSIACPPCHSKILSFFQWIWSFITSLFCCIEKRDPFEETKKILENKEYTLKGHTHRMKTSLHYSADQTTKYDPGIMIRCMPYQNATKLEVTKRDFIDRACEEEDVTLIHHTHTQALQIQGELYLRSGLSFAHEKKKDLFPLDGNAVLFSPLVPIFRQRKKENYALMDTMQKASVVTSVESEDKQRIWNELFAAFENKCKTVVFAVSGNVTPYLYLDILQNFFPGTFKKVVFAILDEHNYATYADTVEKFHEQIAIE